ncbi:hypothetical protein J6590_042935 [Homalodisca vitripennis]|nr:hypothetical protein J6590_042935 [Homalodisca vitripennis]
MVILQDITGIVLLEERNWKRTRLGSGRRVVSEGVGWSLEAATIAGWWTRARNLPPTSLQFSRGRDSCGDVRTGGGPAFVPKLTAPPLPRRRLPALGRSQSGSRDGGARTEPPERGVHVQHQGQEAAAVPGLQVPAGQADAEVGHLAVHEQDLPRQHSLRRRQQDHPGGPSGPLAPAQQQPAPRSHQEHDPPEGGRRRRHRETPEADRGGDRRRRQPPRGQDHGAGSVRAEAHHQEGEEGEEEEPVDAAPGRLPGRQRRPDGSGGLVMYSTIPLCPVLSGTERDGRNEETGAGVRRILQQYHLIVVNKSFPRSNQFKISNRTILWWFEPLVSVTVVLQLIGERVPSRYTDIGRSKGRRLYNICLLHAVRILIRVCLWAVPSERAICAAAAGHCSRHNRPRAKPPFSAGLHSRPLPLRN